MGFKRMVQGPGPASLYNRSDGRVRSERAWIEQSEGRNRRNRRKWPYLLAPERRPVFPQMRGNVPVDTEQATGDEIDR